MMADTNKPFQKKIPVRRCVGCGEHLPKAELVRVLRTPEGEVEARNPAEEHIYARRPLASKKRASRKDWRPRLSALSLRRYTTEWKKKLAMAENNGIKRVLGMLGLAMKAGKVVIGTEQVIAFIQKRRIKLVLLSSGSSDGTKKKIRSKCEYYQVPLAELPIQTDELGDLLGKTYTPAVVGITDENFSRAITRLLDEENA